MKEIGMRRIFFFLSFSNWFFVSHPYYWTRLISDYFFTLDVYVLIRVALDDGLKIAYEHVRGIIIESLFKTDVPVKCSPNVSSSFSDFSNMSRASSPDILLFSSLSNYLERLKIPPSFGRILARLSTYIIQSALFGFMKIAIGYNCDIFRRLIAFALTSRIQFLPLSAT
jgi:hypothetical protein